MIDYKQLNKKPDYLEDYQMSKSIYMTVDEQEELFKIGQDIYIRHDAKNYTYAWVNEMYCTLGYRFTIEYIGRVSSVPMSSFFDYCEYNDLIIYIIDKSDHKWYFHYRSIFHPRQSIPSYKPRYKK